MARKSIDAKLRIVAAGTSASTSVTTASSAGIGDLTIDTSRTTTEVASRGINQKRVLTGLQSVIITGSAEADATGLSVLRTAHNAGNDVYAKLEFADGSSVTGQFACTKLSTDDPVDGEERWDFELQPSATATPDSNGDVITFAAASSSST